VVPELASREHLRAIVPVVREALDRSGTALEDLAAIAATVGRAWSVRCWWASPTPNR
jgi:N6-L-threonylcarbamoyladenine synthase